MATYILATKRVEGRDARLFAADDLAAFARQLSTASRLLGETRRIGEFGRHIVVLDADPAAVDELRSRLPRTVLLEEPIRHETAPIVRFTITGDGNPLRNARVLGFVAAGDGTTLKLGRVADDEGMVEFDAEEHGGVLDTIAIRPFGGYWSRVVADPPPNTVIECQRLPPGPGAWWHELLGVEPTAILGNGIRIGVIDSGVGPHPFLKYTDLGTFLHGAAPRLPGNDDNGHGTHVAGLLGATSMGPGQYAGVARGATLASARVCGESSDAHQGDIANAMDALSEDFGADLVNLSLAAHEPSTILREAVQDAYDRGTLCVCASGNTGGTVCFPGAFPETIAVGALGKQGWGAPGSLATLHVPSDSALHGSDGFYLATFSCFGNQLFCVAPGVGIISSIPSACGLPLFAEMDGTSMASPLACGVLAALLSKDSNYRQLPKNWLRADHARALLRAHCKPIGLSSMHAGHGCPRFVSVP